MNLIASTQNFISLSMVAGFFLGIIFAILNFDDPVTIVVVAIVVTFSFHMMVVFLLSFFLQTYVTKDRYFHKDMFEDSSEEITDRLSFSEKEIDRILYSIHKVRTQIEHQVGKNG